MTSASRLVGVSVLLVDDDRDGREMLEAFLSFEGAIVRTALAAEDALELFKAEPPTIVVTDIAMPHRDGLWLLQQIQSIRTTRIPVVALTGRVLDRERALLQAAGFDAQVIKPVDLEALVDVITRVSGRMPMSL